MHFPVRDVKRAIKSENIKGLVEADTLKLILTAMRLVKSQKLYKASDRRCS